MVTAIIPARGGSQGIPMKNLREIEGISLLGRAINACLAVKAINAVLVSTDNDQIASEASRYGAKVVARPAELATGLSKSEDALLHAIRAGGIRSDIIAFVECTSPFIISTDLEAAIELVSSGAFDSAFSIAESDELFWAGNPEALEPVFHNPKVQTVRQERAKLYKETGAFYCFRRELFLTEKNRFVGRVGGVVVARETAIEIDYPSDLVVARALASFIH